jgi:hypothetical protein
MSRHLIATAAAIVLAIGAAAASSGDRRGSHDDGAEFEARLSGAEEVPPVVTDTTGKVEIKFNDDETSAEYELTVRKGVRVTQSHIHCAAKGVNGPIVVFLAGFHSRGWDVDGRWVENATFTDANVMPPASPACTHVITNLRELAAAIRAGDAYVNVHTVAHPGGEVRGQLQGEKEDHDQR